MGDFASVAHMGTRNSLRIRMRATSGKICWRSCTPPNLSCLWLSDLHTRNAAHSSESNRHLDLSQFRAMPHDLPGPSTLRPVQIARNLRTPHLPRRHCAATTSPCCANTEMRCKPTPYVGSSALIYYAGIAAKQEPQRGRNMCWMCPRYKRVTYWGSPPLALAEVNVIYLSPDENSFLEDAAHGREDWITTEGAPVEFYRIIDWIVSSLPSAGVFDKLCKEKGKGKTQEAPFAIRCNSRTKADPQLRSRYLPYTTKAHQELRGNAFITNDKLVCSLFAALTQRSQAAASLEAEPRQAMYDCKQLGQRLTQRLGTSPGFLGTADHIHQFLD